MGRVLRSVAGWHRAAPPLQHAQRSTIATSSRETVRSLHALTPRQLHRRADAALQFSRQIGGDFADSFHLGEKLIDLLGGTDPASIDLALDEARQSVRDGSLSPDRAIERLMAQYGKRANGDDGPLLATAFRRALTSDQPFAKLFSEVKEQQSEIPDAQQRESMAFCRRQHALQYQREHGVQLDADEFIPAGEMDRAIKLVDCRRGLSFDDALKLVRTGH